MRYAFSVRRRGACYQEILKGLNAMEQEEDTGLVWENNRLTTLLRHEAYIGDVLTNKSYCPARHVQVANKGERDQYYIEAHHEPIVDPGDVGAGAGVGQTPAALDGEKAVHAGGAGASGLRPQHGRTGRWKGESAWRR